MHSTWAALPTTFAKGPPVFLVLMAGQDPHSNVRHENRRLREAVEQCRELMKRTQELLERAHKPDQPSND